MNLKDFGNYLVILRKQKNMTQEQLAEKMHVSSKTISRWECGSSWPDISYLNQICDIFDITMSNLIEGNKAGSHNLIQLLKQSKSNRRLLKVVSLITLIILSALVYSLTKIIVYEKYRIEYSKNIRAYEERWNVVDNKKYITKSDSNCDNYYTFYDLKICNINIEEEFEYIPVQSEEMKQKEFKSFKNEADDIFIMLYRGDRYNETDLSNLGMYWEEYLDIQLLEDPPLDISIFSSIKNIKSYYNYIKNIESQPKVTAIYEFDINDGAIYEVAIKSSYNDRTFVYITVIDNEKEKLYSISLSCNYNDSEIEEFIKNIELL